MSNEASTVRLFTAGRFLDAASTIVRAASDPVLSLELDHYLGYRGRVRMGLERLLTKQLSPLQLARCLCVQSSHFREEGDFSAAASNARRAADLARESGEPGLTARALALLLDAEFATVEFHGSRITALETRRMAIRAADPAVPGPGPRDFWSIGRPSGSLRPRPPPFRHGPAFA